MIIGIGTDIVEISRISASIERLGDKFVNRILTPVERERYKSFANEDKAAGYVAKRFAAKEAAVKALGTGIGSGVSFQHFSVLNLPSGQPYLEVSNELADKLDGPVNWHISLSDEQMFALAFVTLEAK